MGYDVSVLSDGIGDRDIPGATAKQLVDVSTVDACCVLFVCRLSLLGNGNVMVEEKAWGSAMLFCGRLWKLTDCVKTVLAELGDVSATIISSKDL